MLTDTKERDRRRSVRLAYWSVINILTIAAYVSAIYYGEKYLSPLGLVVGISVPIGFCCTVCGTAAMELEEEKRWKATASQVPPG
jgi:hypothetical protein